MKIKLKIISINIFYFDNFFLEQTIYILYKHIIFKHPPELIYYL